MDSQNATGAIVTELILDVFRLNGLLLAAGDRIAQPVGLTSARWQVLGVVEHAPSPVATVARVMGLSRQTVQQTADGLASAGFIVYHENPNHRRAKLLQITEKGQQALAYVRHQQVDWAARISGDLSPAVLHAALQAMRDLIRNLEADLVALDHSPTQARLQTANGTMQSTDSPQDSG